MTTVQRVLGPLIAVTIVASTAFALNNDAVTVRRVEVTSDQVLIHTVEVLGSRPSCAAIQTVMGCSLSDVYCEHAMRVALAAQLSGRRVDADLASTCVSGQVSSIARFNRIRIDD